MSIAGFFTLVPTFTRLSHAASSMYPASLATGELATSTGRRSYHGRLPTLRSFSRSSNSLTMQPVSPVDCTMRTESIVDQVITVDGRICRGILWTTVASIHGRLTTDGSNAILLEPPCLLSPKSLLLAMMSCQMTRLRRLRVSRIPNHETGGKELSRPRPIPSEILGTASRQSTVVAQ